MSLRAQLYTALVLAAGLLLADTPARADSTIAYSYGADGGVPKVWGTAKKENYDVAIRLCDGSLAGKKVTGVRIPLAGEEGLSGFKVWLSRELTLQTVDGKKTNVPDIVSVDAVPQGNMLDVTFAEPYELTAEGVYVGWSFNVDELTDMAKNPIVMTEGTEADGLYLHTSRTYLNWNGMAGKIGGVSAAVVTVSGDFASNSVAMYSAADVNVARAQASGVPVILANHGLSEVTSVDYSYSVAGLSGVEHLDLPEPLSVNYTKKAGVVLPLPAIADKGHYGLTLEITAVNGADNGEPYRYASSAVDVYSFVPVHRPVVEEYTGMWCGWCPKGFVGLELMNKYYGKEFVGLSYHNRDGMEVMSSSDFPSYISGYPAAWLDRIERTDAYFGDSNTGFGIDKLWKSRRDLLAPASIEPEAAWSDAGHTAIDVTTEVTFIRDATGVDYRIAYVLVADSLHDDSWVQENYFSSNNSYRGMEGLDRFVDAGPEVTGLYFNDVVVNGCDLHGIEGSLPSDIEADRTYTHTYRFDLSGAVNTSGESLVQDKANLRVVVMLIDAATGEVLNANRTESDAEAPAGIAGNAMDDGIESVTFHDLAGRRISTPSGGIYVKAVRYGNGVTKASKVILRQDR